VFVIVTIPVAESTLIPDPAAIVVTPVFVNVRVPPSATGLPSTLIPLPFTVMELLSKFAFGMLVGKSATTSDRNVGTAAAPVVGPENIVLAV
jgi:hypothetical protein